MLKCSMCKKVGDDCYDAWVSGKCDYGDKPLLGEVILSQHKEILMNKSTKAVRKKVIEYLSKSKGCSFSVAAHIIDCMSIDDRQKFYDLFRQKAK